MAKQTSSKSSGAATPGTAKKKRTSEAPAPITGTILKADHPVTIVQDVIVDSKPNADPTHEQIALRAFELYQQRSDGALNDWLTAERELRRPSLS